MPRASVRLGSCAVVLAIGAVAAYGAGIHTADAASSDGSRATSDGSRATPAVHRAKPTCGGVRPPKPGGGRYTCTFTDDFSGSALDPAKWSIVESADTGLSTRAGGCYRADRENVSVGGGTLRLTSRVAPTTFYCRKGLLGIFTRHSAASVASAATFTQKYGRFAFRAMFPKTNAAVIDSALWMYPAHQTYGRWPASGELDVAERFGSARGYNIYPSLHYAGPDGRVTNTGMHCRVAKADTSFHTYAVQWTKASIKFYYDNRLCFAGSWAPAAPLVPPQPFDQPFYMVMTQTDRPKDTPAGTHDTMTIDWVRVWR